MKHLTKSTIAALLVLSMTAGLAGCGSSNTTTADKGSAPTETEQTELVVFAAASMTETLEEIKETYEAEHEGMGTKVNEILLGLTIGN